MNKRTLLTGLLAGILALGAAAQNDDYAAYHQVVGATANMVADAHVGALAHKYGLDVLSVTWEDTGRYNNSAVGPNISDMTLQIQQQNPKTKGFELTCMPVIRYPNFVDKTADLKLEDFFMLVGNEKGKDLHKVSLRDYLASPQNYMSLPQKVSPLLAKRDSHALVSAQACFLPIPKGGTAKFNPVLFNYQSYKGDPAVLTILATREGTSMTIIDNQRDGFAAGQTWGQRLFFNQNGQRASLTGQRQSDFAQTNVSVGPQAADQQGLNMVLLVQVPLKQKNPMRMNMNCCDACAAPPTAGSVARRGSSDVESAVIGHGALEGPFTETDNLAIERDPNFPVRVTVQFYKATSNGVVSEGDMADIHAQLQKVYAHGDYVGSLVVGKADRPTAYEGEHTQPKEWWDEFWKRCQQNLGMNQTDAEELWKKLHLKARAD